MASLTSQLIVSLVDRVTGPARAVAGSVKSLSDRLRSAQGSYAAGAGRLQSQMFGAVAAGFSLQRALAAPIKIAAEFETALLDIGQKADLSDGAIKSLGDRIRALAPTINQTSAEVAKGIDTLVGMGLDPKQAETLLGPIGKAATAYNAAITDLSKAGFATLDNLKVKAEDFGKALDIMAQSGKEGAFEIKDMAQHFPQLTAAAQALKMTGVDAVGRLSAALQIARKGAGDGSTAANNVANAMQKIISPETTKKFTKLGVDIRKELKKTQDAGGDIFEMLATQVQKALKGDMSKLGDLFEDKQVRDFLNPLIANLEEYKRIKKEAMGSDGVVKKDFERRMITNAAQTAAFSIRLKELGLTIGNILLPSMNELTGSLSPLLKSFEKFADANPHLVGGAIKVVAALVAARVAAIAARFAFGFLASAFLAVAAPAAAMVLALGRIARLAVLAGVIRPLIATMAALRSAMLGLVVVGTLGGVRMALTGMAVAAVALLNPLRLLPALLGGAAIAMRGLGAAMLMIPGAAALVAIGAAGTFIYNNWKGLGTFFTSFFKSLKSNLESMDGGRFEGLSDAIENISKVWTKWTGTISDKSWAEAGASAGDSVAKSIRTIADAIEDVMQKWESFKSVWNKVQDVLQYKPLDAAPPGPDGKLPPGKQRQKEAEEARRKRWEEDRGRLDVPIIGNGTVGKQGSGGADGWGKGAEAIKQYDMAGAAGQAAGSSFNTTLGAQLDQAKSLVAQAVQEMQRMLNFSASPTITPKIGGLTGKGAGLNVNAAKHAANSDATNFATV